MLHGCTVVPSEPSSLGPRRISRRSAVGQRNIIYYSSGWGPAGECEPGASALGVEYSGIAPCMSLCVASLRSACVDLRGVPRISHFALDDGAVSKTSTKRSLAVGKAGAGGYKTVGGQLRATGSGCNRIAPAGPCSGTGPIAILSLCNRGVSPPVGHSHPPAVSKFHYAAPTAPPWARCTAPPQTRPPRARCPGAVPPAAWPARSGR